MNSELSAKSNKGRRVLSQAALCVIFVFALLLRVYPVIRFPENIKSGMGQFGDSGLYQAIAYNLYQYKGFCAPAGLAYGQEEAQQLPVIVRPPVYPFFVSAVYGLFGNRQAMRSIDRWHENWDRVRIAQCILDACICIVLYCMARSVYPSSRAPAFIASYLYCFSLYNIFYTRALLSETVATFLLSVSIFFFIRGLQRDSKGFLMWAGAGLGLTILTRAEYLFLPLVLAFYLYSINKHNLRAAIKKSVIFIASTVVIIVPWTIRNYIVFKEPILVSTGQLGYSLFLGTFEGSTKNKWWGDLPEEISADPQEKERVTALYQEWDRLMSVGGIQIQKVDRQFMDMALRRIQKQPLRCLKAWLTNIPRLWYQNYAKLYYDTEAPGTYFIFYFLIAMYAFLRSSRAERLLVAPIFLIFIYLSIIFLPLHIEPRYGVALMPALIFLTGAGLWKLFKRGGAPGAYIACSIVSLFHVYAIYLP